jgi:pimeloyl-ACP methyl ester carboxylesterase
MTLRTSSLMLALATGSLAAVSGFVVAQPVESILEESYLVPSGDPGIELFLRNKRSSALTTFRADRTVVYVHGSTQASETTFDLALDGMSWMDHIAAHGWDVWLMDVRGYGGSTKPPEMDRPATDNSPIATVDVAMRDVRVVIEHILGKRGLPRISLIGWSRGAGFAAWFSSENPDKVHRLVLYAPGWIRTASRSAGQAAGLPAYHTWTMVQARSRLQTGVPSEKQAAIMPAPWFDAWAAATLATDPIGARETPSVVRSPGGPLQDGRDYWDAGKAPYDPSRITTPTLIVAAEWDGVNPPSLARALFTRLTSVPFKRLVEIGEASHLVMLERNRLQLFREVQLFLDEPEPRPQ